MDKAKLIFGPERIAKSAAGYGFHCTPYDFDSRPEVDFYEKVLRALGLEPTDVQDVYFTGAITDPGKTDLVFSCEAPDGRIRQYTPDFVIRAAADRWLLVEVKSIGRRDYAIEGRNGRKAQTMQAIADRNPGRVTYRMVFADAEVDPRDIRAVRDFLRE